jgi:hypothetical protein
MVAPRLDLNLFRSNLPGFWIGVSASLLIAAVSSSSFTSRRIFDFFLPLAILASID